MKHQSNIPSIHQTIYPTINLSILFTFPFIQSSINCICFCFSLNISFILWINAQTFIFNDREKNKAEGRVLCIPCCRETIEADATKYCITCKDPEPLCDFCAQHHTRRKESKDHEISDDLQQLAVIADKHKYVFNYMHIIFI